MLLFEDIVSHCVNFNEHVSLDVHHRYCCQLNEVGLALSSDLRDLNSYQSVAHAWSSGFGSGSGSYFDDLAYVEGSSSSLNGFFVPISSFDLNAAQVSAVGWSVWQRPLRDLYAEVVGCMSAYRCDRFALARRWYL
ncbi:hypothetical protein DVH05_026694 [Phytophthora capsici]|nr:hypothetical protein DVH05_012765 [Phytophthora capsici]KAG1691683.1 hypothetical protein DVH05_026694 [Phytophthora capsici]